MVSFDGHGPLSTAVYDRSQLLADNVIEGPAVIEEDASTTLVCPRDVATINRFGHIVLTIGVLGGDQISRGVSLDDEFRHVRRLA